MNPDYAQQLGPIVKHKFKGTTNLLYPGRLLILIPALAVKIGLNEAIVLQQLHYWSRRTNHLIQDERWVYNTLREWQDQFPFWQERTLRRTFRSLAVRGLIRIEQHNKKYCDRTNWYAINYEEVHRLAPDVEKIAASLSKAQTAKATKRRIQQGQLVPFDGVELTHSLT